MLTIYTVGHSTTPIEEFIELLHAQGIERLVDVRTIPNSRHNPQFSQEALADSLRQAGIDYVYLKELGGLRSKAPRSENDGWRNQSFRNYADYMQTEEFVVGIENLVRLGEEKVTVIMCAEAVPWRCHRSLVGDALLIRGIRVVDVISRTSILEHALTSFALVDGLRITYPAP